jgi:hypothetical protein
MARRDGGYLRSAVDAHLKTSSINPPRRSAPPSLIPRSSRNFQHIRHRSKPDRTCSKRSPSPASARPDSGNMARHDGGESSPAANNPHRNDRSLSVDPQSRVSRHGAYLCRPCGRLRRADRLRLVPVRIDRDPDAGDRPRGALSRNDSSATTTAVTRPKFAAGSDYSVAAACGAF